MWEELWRTIKIEKFNEEITNAWKGHTVELYGYNVYYSASFWGKKLVNKDFMNDISTAYYVSLIPHKKREYVGFQHEERERLEKIILQLQQSEGDE